jgi:NAD(P)-dependent dehydrogenase (short-subunit alcohol dehydrogenase family)
MRLVETRRAVLGASASVAALLWPRFGRSAGLIGVAPPTSFGRESTAEEVTAGLDLAGKTVLITGATSGIGFETARVLAARGAHVIATGRSIEGAERACRRLTGAASPVALELTDFDSVVRCAEEVQRLAPSLDVVVCNAGVMGLRTLERANGVEMHFAVNHLGHFLLVARLRAALERAAAGRVVVVASNAYAWAPPEGLRLDDLTGDSQRYDWRTAYGASKLANGLFARELARRSADTALTANSLHPGLIHTELWRHEPWLDRLRMYFRGGRMKTVEQGAATTCYVATSPSLAGVSGHYFEDCNAVIPGGQMENDALAAQLWRVCEELVAAYVD